MCRLSPRGGTQLSVLISPPNSARTKEYKNVWLGPHTVTMYFRWNAKTASATPFGGSKASPGSSGSMSDMTGMSSMSGHTNASVNGVKAPRSRLITTSYWQGMRIQTRSANPMSYYMPASKALRKISPPAGSSFYMMVMLDDEHTSEAVTYAPVYATIKSSSGNVVYSGRLEPTISAFEGPYYGNNVKLPRAGHYTLTVRIDPPHQARHLEYQHVWLHPHTVTEHFVWSGKQ
jgi:Fe2+ transport protein